MDNPLLDMQTKKVKIAEVAYDHVKESAIVGVIPKMSTPKRPGLGRKKSYMGLYYSYHQPLRHCNWFRKFKEEAVAVIPASQEEEEDQV